MARPDVVRWLPPATPASEPPARFGRWQQVIMDALDQYEVVGLRAVVEGHLGRRGARSESIAARRAAHLLARCGRVNLARVRVPPARGRRGAELLVIAPAEINPATLTDEALRKAATRYLAAVDRTREALADIVAAIDQAAAQVAAVDLHAVDTDAAGQTAQALAVPLRQLTQLRHSLLARRPRS